MNEVMHKQLIMEIRNDEMMQISNTVDNIAYGNQRMIQTLFSYKFKDDVDFIDVTNEACKEYHDGKCDMLCNSKPSRQPKKKKQQKKPAK